MVKILVVNKSSFDLPSYESSLAAGFSGYGPITLGYDKRSRTSSRVIDSNTAFLSSGFLTLEPIKSEEVAGFFPRFFWKRHCEAIV